MSFAIFTDTSANLPTPYLRQHDVVAVPFTYFIHGNPYNCLDTENFDSAAYYNGIREGIEVTTSLVSPQTYLDAMRPVLDAGQDILFVGMSSGISGSFGAAGVAAAQLREEFPGREIWLVDSIGASLGEGLLVMRAVERRAEGRTVSEVAQELTELRMRICQVFTVDDLMHLRRTGRLSNAGAVIGTVLNIKPLLQGNENGNIVSFGKVRGRRRVIEAMAENYDQWVVEPERQTVCIAHADCAQDMSYLAELLRAKQPPKDILVVDYEPVTGSHVGPGALALFFEGRPGFRLKG